VAVTVTLLIKFWRTHVAPESISHPAQPPKVPFGTAVKVTSVPVGKLPVQEPPGVAAQPKPAGELEIVPVPEPAKFMVMVGPVPVKQVTVAIILPETTAPDDDTPEASALVWTVAVMRAPPQTAPVAVIRPPGVTVII
jgi:hypothetical protein